MEEKEAEKSAKSIIENLIIPRIKHPLIGTFMFSFFINNFDIIYMLLISPRDNYIGIATFYAALITEPSRYWFPAIIALLVFAFEPLLSYVKLHWETFLEAISERILERERKISLKYRIESLEESVKKIENENDFLKQFLQDFLLNINTHLSSELVNQTFALGSPGLRKGQLVAIDKDTKITNFYVGNSGLKCIGLIREVVKPGLYLVESPKDWLEYIKDKFKTISDANNALLVFNVVSNKFETADSITANLIHIATGRFPHIFLSENFKAEVLGKGSLENLGSRIYKFIIDGDYEKKRSLLD